MLLFLIGFFVGGACGIIAMALCVAGRDRGEDE